MAAIYVSGSGAGLCASCGASSTSGSWRRGWTVPADDGSDAGHANLCNRCGQRWQKAGRPSSLAGLRQAEERKSLAAAKGGAAAGGGSAGAPPSALRLAAGGALKRPQPSPAASLAAAVAGAKRPRPRGGVPTPPLRRPRRLSTEEDEDESMSALGSPSSSADTLTPSLNAAAMSFGPRPAAPAAAPVGRHQQPEQRLPTGSRQPAMSAAAADGAAASGSKAGAPVVTASGRRFVSYCIQKLSSARANHAAFWLQDDVGQSLLAVVGTDARLSGHFTYTTTPAMMELGVAPALRCTSRSQVEAWLAGWGMTNLVAEGSVRLPELSAEERRRLLNPEEPVWARPSSLDAAAYTGVREESGRLTDGRHFKRFWLLGAGGREKLVVSGVDSSRKDRRYKYLAEEDMGGFQFENSRDVMSWVNFVLQRSPSDALEAQQARAERHLKEEELGSLLPRLRAAQQLERLPPPPSAPRPPSRQQLEAERQPAAPPGAPEGPASAAMARAAAAAAKAGTAGSGRAGGKVRPLASLQLLPSGSKGPSAEDEAAPAGAPEPASGGFAPQPPLSAARPGALLALRCASCGLTTHQTEQCPLALISPPSLVPGPSCTRKQSLLLFKPLASPSSGASSPGDQLWAEPSPQLFTKEQLLQQGEGGDGAGGSPQREAAAPGLQPTSAAVQQAFGAYPRLLSFVAAAPAPASAAAFEALADKLCSHISDLPPPLPSSHLDTPVRGWSWCSTAEALRILRQLATMPVSLALLRTTGISAAVAQLRTHRDRDIAAAAAGVVERWRTAAVAALEQATGGLEGRA